jgi:hypothetical protein
VGSDAVSVGRNQCSAIHDQSALYRVRGKVFAPLNKVGFIPQWCKGCLGEVCNGGI